MEIKFKTTFEKNNDYSSGTISNEDGDIVVELLIDDVVLKKIHKSEALEETEEKNNDGSYIGKFTLIQ